MTVALSLRNPWAWMVVHGGKTIENRRWDTKRRGDFLVHAAKGMTLVEYGEAIRFARRVNPELVVPPREQLLFGGIVGRARIVDMLPPCATREDIDDPNPRCRCGQPWHMAHQFGFVLADVAPVDFVPMSGMLGFFDVSKARKS